MKKFLTVALAALAILPLAAQTTDWQKRYEKQAAAVGISGVGVETILDKWGQADSTNLNYLEARFAFYYDKGHRVEVESHDTPKYLGMNPLFHLGDSTGTKKTYYYEVDRFDDELFGKALRYIDKAIATDPSKMDLRVWKISGLMLYEAESPDMTKSAIMSLIDEDRRSNHGWKYQGQDVDREFFDGIIQEFCYNLFTVGTDQSRDAFKTISEKMLSYDRNNVQFIANMGSWYMARKEYKKALKYFDKVLKVDPTNYTAVSNCKTIARVLNDSKLQARYASYKTAE